MATTTEDKRKKLKAYWDDVTSDAFVKICVNETLAGNRLNSHFNKIGWKNIIAKFHSMTDRDYEQKQLKNKWDILKKDWQLWTNLLRNETGLGWDPVKHQLLEIPEAIKFRSKGLKNVDQLEILFKYVAAAGEGSWAPSIGFVPNDGEGGPFNEYVGEDNNMYFQEENVNIEPNNFGGLENIETDINTLAVESGPSIAIRNGENGCSIAEVMEVLHSMPEIKIKSELYLNATKIFLKKENREMFVAIKNRDVQIEWLKFMKDSS
ncbi:L10-interacting MYB domain-containing protein-like [Citrus clementina]|uniref:L10-interacting MYB domain-containing protein-like n=1 Tax=Citrus clementina TaxID=85681 RepID=UPI000CED14A6|nr:L10-interacting MYB domain-containing protein-like [Citrus x clementina]